MAYTRATDAARAKTYGNVLITFGVAPTPIPATALKNRGAIAVFNNNVLGGATLYIGYDTNLNTSNGYPIPPQTGWAEDIWSGTGSAVFGNSPSQNVYAVCGGSAGSTVDVRYTESGTP